MQIGTLGGATQRAAHIYKKRFLFLSLFHSFTLWPVNRERTAPDHHQTKQKRLCQIDTAACW